MKVKRAIIGIAAAAGLVLPLLSELGARSAEASISHVGGDATGSTVLRAISHVGGD